MDSNLEKEFQFYLDNQEELVKKYDGKYIVIKDKKVIVSAESEVEAMTTASKEYELGSFLIQYVSPGDNAYTQTFHSRVAFN